MTREELIMVVLFMAGPLVAVGPFIWGWGSLIADSGILVLPGYALAALIGNAGPIWLVTRE